MTKRNGFDKLARAYRLLEYASFGPLLWQTRVVFLPALNAGRRALVLGDGDGRFTAALLSSSASVQVVAVDASQGMLDRLKSRVEKQGDARRLSVLHGDATGTLPAGEFDLVCTHFFLDCLAQTEVDRLVPACTSRVQAGARWVISEFAIPSGIMRVPAWLLVRCLYLAFRGLTGLRVRRLPDYAAALRRSGWSCVGVRSRLAGVLRSELWEMPTGHASASNAL